jgi:hypothetical protein
MSTHYGLRKSIKGDELFDGRLEAFGVREKVGPAGAADRFPPYMKVKEVRYLTDGRNSMEVVANCDQEQRYQRQAERTTLGKGNIWQPGWASSQAISAARVRGRRAQARPLPWH